MEEVLLVTKEEKSLSVFALGGLNEIGKNMYAIQYDEDIVIIDCGNKFPDESLLGVDLIIPDISYLINHKDKVKALIITHGHEDHIGGIPFFLKQLNVPIYATRFTLGLIEIKLKEHKLLRESELIEINPDSRIDIGKMAISFFKVFHSIPDCVGIVFHTPMGNIVNTGDFKFDLTPANKEYSDIHRMAEIGQAGVLLLLSESTNAERPGFTPSEQMVGEHLEQAFMKADGKVFVTTFASNVSRLQQVIHAADKTNRKLALLGRTMINVVKVATELGYLTVPEEMLIEPRDINEFYPEDVAILCTGSQGEPLAALARLSTGDFRDVDVFPGDTVILAAGPIPGNERGITSIVDNLYALGAHVIYGTGSSSGMHVSGHGYQEDLKLMLTLMKPKYFIPIHGEYRMLYHHRMLAESVGVEEGNTFILKNGEVVDIMETSPQQVRDVPVGNTYIDGGEVGDLEYVLRDRRQLSEDGMIMIIVTIDKNEAQLLVQPEILSRGFTDEDFSKLRKKILQITSHTIEELQAEDRMKRNIIKKQIKRNIRQSIYRHTKKEPMIVPILIEV